MSQSNIDGAHMLGEIKKGSCAAFEQFYHQYAKLVYNIAYQKTGDPAEAEDVCHDVFLEVLDKPDQYDRERGSIEAWLIVKTRSRCLDRLRRRSKVKWESWEEADFRWRMGASLDDTVLRKIELESVRAAIRRLPVHQQQALLGSYVEGRTHKELSATLGRPLGSVKTMIRSGLKQLRRHLVQSDSVNSRTHVGGRQHE